MQLFFLVPKGQLVHQPHVFSKHWPILAVVSLSVERFTSRGRKREGFSRWSSVLASVVRRCLGSLETSLKEYSSYQHLSCPLSLSINILKDAHYTNLQISPSLDLSGAASHNLKYTKMSTDLWLAVSVTAIPFFFLLFSHLLAAWIGSPQKSSFRCVYTASCLCQGQDADLQTLAVASSYLTLDPWQQQEMFLPLDFSSAYFPVPLPVSPGDNCDVITTHSKSL